MATVRRLKPVSTPVPALGRRRVVRVDACEIDCVDGCLTIRAGHLEREPLLVALPAHAAESLPDVLATASLDAEEEYWDNVGAVIPEGSDPEAVDVAVGEWVLAQDWATGLDDLIESDEDMFLVVQFGFVGMVLGPPFTAVPAFAIFDPMQLRRLGDAIRQAVEDGMRTSHPIWSTAVVDRTLQTLAARPWAGLESEEPTAEEARAEMHDRRVEFLARTPRFHAR